MSVRAGNAMPAKPMKESLISISGARIAVHTSVIASTDGRNSRIRSTHRMIRDELIKFLVQDSQMPNWAVLIIAVLGICFGIYLRVIWDGR